MTDAIHTIFDEGKWTPRVIICWF